MFINRGLRLLKRRRIAENLGFKFDRAANFSLPENIIINGKLCKLHLPYDHGVKIAFIDLLLDDCYGCRNLRKKNSSIKTVLDIGANVGLFGIMARNTFPDAVIHAYEPNPYLEAYLNEQSNSAGFKYFLKAVGLNNGKVSLAFQKESVLTRSVSDGSGEIEQVAFRDTIALLGG